jgi:Zn-dependent M28 family amino/carboxypeptidase
VPALVAKVDKARLQSTLTNLISFGSRDSYATQETVLKWIKTNLDIAGAQTHWHTYPYNWLTWHNLVATIPGDAALDPDEPRLVVGAHIDTVAGSPGADDNASGVAAVMEAARVLASSTLNLRVDFVFFTQEESGRIGSTRYAADAKAAGEDILAMIAVDSIAFGSADEDLDIATRPAMAWVAEHFQEASIQYTDLKTNLVIDEGCG